MLNNKVVLVTGGTGSFGKKFIQTVLERYTPTKLIVLSRDELKQFEMQQCIAPEHMKIMRFFLGDVRDKDRLLMAFRDVDYIVHAAALKQVPAAEYNPQEFIKTNVLGAMNIIEAALFCKVKKVLALSTDKACNPVNLYGATKLCSDKLFVAGNAYRCIDDTVFSVVRYGNVMGSRGSVVPLFKRMIASGGPLQITHPDMFRFFMTIPEAVHLVLQAAAMGKGGEAFLLNMGEQIRILDLAEDLIRLSGLEPGRDIEIVFTGVRPGEKLREELWESDKTYDPTAHPDVYRSTTENMITSSLLQATLERLKGLVESSQPDEIISLLDEVVPGSAIRATLPPVDVTDVV